MNVRNIMINKLSWNFASNYINNAPINIMEVGEEHCDNTYYIYRENSPIYAIEYIVSGDQNYSINGEDHIAIEGDIIIIPINSNHSYKFHTMNCHKLWIVFDGSIIETLLSAYLQRDCYIFHQKELLTDFEEIIRFTQNNHDEHDKILSNVSALLHKILIELHTKVVTQSIRSTPDKIMKFIDDNINIPFSLQWISDQFSYTKSHIIVMFKAQFNITPQQYYINKKIEVACIYLRTTRYSISHISDSLFFADQHYFSNCFSKIKGISPSEYRKNLIFRNR